MDRLSIPKLAHLETLSIDDLPRLEERRKVVYAAMDSGQFTRQDYNRLYDMMMWLTEQIAYLKAKQRNEVQS